MSRLTTFDPAQATGETRELLDATQRTFGVIPNTAKILASSPAALKTWLESIRALAAGQLDPGLRERIALGMAETNACERDVGDDFGDLAIRVPGGPDLIDIGV